MVCGRYRSWRRSGSEPSATSREHLFEQLANPCLALAQLLLDLRARPRWRIRVEKPSERDLVADLAFVIWTPCARYMRADLAIEVGLHILAERDVLGVAAV